MPNATVRTNARTMPDEPSPTAAEQIATTLKYEAAYSEWLAAKAATFNPARDDADVVADRLFGRLQAAERVLIATRAPAGWAVLQKLEFVEGMVAHDYEAGRPTYPLTILALAAVKADMLAIGFRED